MTHLVGAAHAFAISDAPVILSLYSGQASAADVHALQSVIHRAFARHHRPLTLFSVVEQNARIPASDRAAIAELLSAGNPLVASWAIVIEGSGIWASAARAITTSVFIRARPAYSLKVFGKAEVGAEWLRTQPCTPLPSTWPRDMAALREQLRSNQARSRLTA